MENETQETKVWKSIDELIVESNKTHIATSDYLGAVVKFAWKELSENDTIDYDIGDVEVEKLSKKEKDLMMRDTYEATVLKMIEKAGMISGCTNDNIITKETWKKLPLRVRMGLMIDVGNYKKSLQNDFLSQ